MADVVIWTGDPFSVYAAPRRSSSTAPCCSTADDPAHAWRTDFELGTVRETTAAPLPATPGGVR